MQQTKVILRSALSNVPPTLTNHGTHTSRWFLSSLACFRLFLFCPWVIIVLSRQNNCASADPRIVGCCSLLCHFVTCPAFRVSHPTIASLAYLNRTKCLSSTLSSQIAKRTEIWSAPRLFKFLYHQTHYHVSIKWNPSFPGISHMPRDPSFERRILSSYNGLNSGVRETVIRGECQ